MSARADTAGPLLLTPAARDALATRIEQALTTARRRGVPVLASVTQPLDPGVDVSAVVARGRREHDRWFCLEQPDRDGFALAALGTASVTETTGAERFRQVASAVRAVARNACAGDPADDPTRPPGSGPVWVGGFAFAAGGGQSPEWRSLAPAVLVLPELTLARRGDEARLTLNAMVERDDDPAAVLARLEGRLADLEAGADMPLLDPHPAEPARVSGAMPPEHYEEAVARAVERIRAGDLEKLVLAREVRVQAAGPIDAAAVLAALREVFPACFCYLVGTPQLAFVGASPELLVRRDGARAQTVALAGTTRRSADPAVDRLLGEQLLQSTKDREEQAIVQRRIERALSPVSVWVAAAEEPVLVKVQNVQHLATPVRAQLKEPVSVVELAGRLHPTPAVGGEPWPRAERLIPALEGLDRGWYAGPVGWCDLAEDGEFCVALRCALVRGNVAHLYAGDGIVRDSVPADELAETEVKFQALLPLLG